LLGKIQNYLKSLETDLITFFQLVAVEAGLKEDYLNEHNRLRKLHGTPPLVLDAALSKGCEEYAQVCPALFNSDFELPIPY